MTSLGEAWLGLSRHQRQRENPFCTYSDNVPCYRDNSYQKAGSINGDQMFHGPAAPFGGVENRRRMPLRLKLEYGVTTTRKSSPERLSKSKFNVGAIYRVTDWADVNFSYERATP